MRDGVTKFSPITIALHWIVGLSMIGLLAVGIYMDTFEVYSLYPIHKSLGILIVAFVIARIIWRTLNGWPKPVSQYSTIEHTLAKVIHWVLIIGTLSMPVSGMMMSGGGGHGLFIFDWELLAKNIDPSDPSMTLPLSEAIASLGKSMHGLLGNIMIAAIVLHVVGAFKHHIIDKDATLRRMLGRST